MTTKNCANRFLLWSDGEAVVTEPQVKACSDLTVGFQATRPAWGLSLRSYGRTIAGRMG